MIWLHLWVGLLMTWTRLWKLFVVKVCLVSDCNGLLKWIFISPSRQTNPGRLFTLSRSLGSCSVIIESARLLRRFGGGRYRQKKCSVLCCKVIDACTTSNDAWVKSKFVLNVMLESKVHLYSVAIPPSRDRDWRGMISRQIHLVLIQQFSLTNQHGHNCSILIIWLGCQFLNTTIKDSSPDYITMLCPWARHYIHVVSVESAVKWVPDWNTLVMDACSLLWAFRRK